VQTIEAASAAVSVRVDASRDVGPLEHSWETLINSENLSYSLNANSAKNQPNGGEGLLAENRMLHDSIGFRYIRAHGIFLDDLQVYREDASGSPVYDWTRVDSLYDRLLSDGLKPFVELSFMPGALAANPGQTIFAYKAITSPPKSYVKWGALVREFAKHLLDRYGQREVESWYFEVWNEPDLHMPLFGDFWHGSSDAYFQLYDYAAEALKSVDPRIRVGGPAAATPDFVEQFLRHIRAGRNLLTVREPLDFLSFHMYSAPLPNWRPLLQRLGFGDLPIFCTEWGVSTRYGEAVNDLPYGAAWLVRVLIESNEFVSLNGYWTGSEYSDEGAPPGKFFHGGFGLLGFDLIRKPRYWAYFLLHELGTTRVALDGSGAAFGALVNGLATRSEGDGLRVLLTNVSYEQTRSSGDPALSQRVELNVCGLMASRNYVVRHFRVDETHSNVYAAWRSIGSPDWPDRAQLGELHRRDTLELLVPVQRLTADASGRISLSFEMPMPSLSMIELIPVTDGLGKGDPTG
jgi:xylan 1,4-beta-xylosidase